MQISGMAESSHGQTAGLHPLHKRVLFVPMAAIDQILPGGGGAALAASKSHSVQVMLGRPRMDVP